MKQLRRFYKAARATPEGLIELDGKAVKTPFKRPLCLPAAGLAEAVAAEWQAQGEKIDPTSMPLTRLANSAIDWVANGRGAVTMELRGYADSDLTLFRATTPVELVAREAAAWDPVLQWARRELDAPFAPINGLKGRQYSEKADENVKRRLDGFDDFTLVALHDITTLTGSALLPLMLEAGAATPEQAWAAAHVEEDWQIAQWGGDAEAEARRARRHHAFMAAHRMTQLCRDPALPAA